jgi:hypothetical protein
MAIMYSIGLLTALLTGGAIGWLVTLAHFERLGANHREYEREMEEAEEFYAARGLLQQMKPDRWMGDNEPLE